MVVLAITNRLLKSPEIRKPRFWENGAFKTNKTNTNSTAAKLPIFLFSVFGGKKDQHLSNLYTLIYDTKKGLVFIWMFFFDIQSFFRGIYP